MLERKEPLRISWAAARVNAGLSQDDVARELHIGKQTLVNWEKNKSEPKISQGQELCALYGVRIDDISIPTKSN